MRPEAGQFSSRSLTIVNSTRHGRRMVGEIVNLTNTPDIREESPLWSPNGTTLAVNYKPKESTVYDIALLDWATRKARKLTNETTKTYSWSAVAWSADGKTLFANRSETSGVPESDVYSIDVP